MKTMTHKKKNAVATPSVRSCEALRVSDADRIRGSICRGTLAARSGKGQHRHSGLDLVLQCLCRHPPGCSYVMRCSGSRTDSLKCWIAMRIWP